MARGGEGLDIKFEAIVTKSNGLFRLDIDYCPKVQQGLISRIDKEHKSNYRLLAGDLVLKINGISCCHEFQLAKQSMDGQQQVTLHIKRTVGSHALHWPESINWDNLDTERVRFAQNQLPSLRPFKSKFKVKEQEHMLTEQKKHYIMCLTAIVAVDGVASLQPGDLILQASSQPIAYKTCIGIFKQLQLNNQFTDTEFTIKRPRACPGHVRLRRRGSTGSTAQTVVPDDASSIASGQDYTYRNPLSIRGQPECPNYVISDVTSDDHRDFSEFSGPRPLRGPESLPQDSSDASFRVDEPENRFALYAQRMDVLSRQRLCIHDLKEGGRPPGYGLQRVVGGIELTPSVRESEHSRVSDMFSEYHTHLSKDGFCRYQICDENGKCDVENKSINLTASIISTASTSPNLSEHVHTLQQLPDVHLEIFELCGNRSAVLRKWLPGFFYTPFCLHVIFTYLPAQGRSQSDHLSSLDPLTSRLLPDYPVESLLNSTGTDSTSSTLEASDETTEKQVVGLISMLKDIHHHSGGMAKVMIVNNAGNPDPTVEKLLEFYLQEKMLLKYNDDNIFFPNDEYIIRRRAIDELNVMKKSHHVQKYSKAAVELSQRLRQSPDQTKHYCTENDIVEMMEDLIQRGSDAANITKRSLEYLHKIGQVLLLRLCCKDSEKNDLVILNPQRWMKSLIMALSQPIGIGDTLGDIVRFQYFKALLSKAGFNGNAPRTIQLLEMLHLIFWTDKAGERSHRATFHMPLLFELRSSVFEDSPPFDLDQSDPVLLIEFPLPVSNITLIRLLYSLEKQAESQTMQYLIGYGKYRLFNATLKVSMNVLESDRIVQVVVEQYHDVDLVIKGLTEFLTQFDLPSGRIAIGPHCPLPECTHSPKPHVINLRSGTRHSLSCGGDPIVDHIREYLPKDLSDRHHRSMSNAGSSSSHDPIRHTKSDTFQPLSNCSPAAVPYVADGHPNQQPRFVLGSLQRGHYSVPNSLVTGNSARHAAADNVMSSLNFGQTSSVTGSEHSSESVLDSLPPTTLEKICSRLNKNRRWRNVAGTMSLSADDIDQLDQDESPSKALLLNYMPHYTEHEFIHILNICKFYDIINVLKANPYSKEHYV